MRAQMRRPDDRDRRVVRLYDIDGLTYRQIAKLENLSAGRIRQIRAKSLKRLHLFGGQLLREALEERILYGQVGEEEVVRREEEGQNNHSRRPQNGPPFLASIGCHRRPSIAPGCNAIS